MALKLLQPGGPPLGQFDMLDTDTAILGGEIGTLSSAARANSTTEKAAADVLDGYVNDAGTLKRAVVTRTLANDNVRPLWLLDEGTKNYGTLFGVTIGVPAGLGTGFASGVYSGTPLGPHTGAASGKVTCWDKPGVYGVTLDAADTAAANGLTPTNTTLTPGSALYATATGLLTPTVAKTPGGAGPVVARFVEFETTEVSLVRTPPSLVGASEQIEHAVISYFLE